MSPPRATLKEERGSTPTTTNHTMTHTDALDLISILSDEAIAQTLSDLGHSVSELDHRMLRDLAADVVLAGENE